MVGIGATFAMDIWAFILNLFHIKSLNYRWVGRWIGNIANGQFYHKNIINASPVKNELLIGWSSHYLIGISFSFLLLLVYGKNWFDKPILLPAILIGIATIIAPFLFMQPAFGLGIAGTNLPKPYILQLKSFMAHFIYGIGLYLTILLINYIKK